MKNRFEITRDTLIELNLDVPEEIINKILERKAEKKAKKKSCLSDQTFPIQKHHLSIKIDEFKEINLKRNSDTFVEALKFIGVDKVKSLDLKIGQHDLICTNPIEKKKYQLIHENLWVYISPSSKNMKILLVEICRCLNLDWEVIMK